VNGARLLSHSREREKPMAPSPVLDTPAALAALRLEHAELSKGDLHESGVISVTGVILATRTHGATSFADLLVAPSRENLHSEARASKQQKNETRASLLRILLEDTL
jgi:hypothetical protein